MHHCNGEIVAAVVEGAVHRYGEIVEQFDDRVRNAIRRRISDYATAEDLVQEAFYRAFKQLDKLEDPQQLEAWLVAIANNCVTDFFRQRSRRKEREHQGGVTLLSRQMERSHSSQATWIWDEVHALPEPHTEILRLRYQQSLSYDEIAERLGLPQSTVRGRIFEARKSLRQRLINKGLFP